MMMRADGADRSGLGTRTRSGRRWSATVAHRVRRRRWHGRPARPGQGPHQRRHHRLAERAAGAVAAGIAHVTIDLSASYAKAVRVALPDAVLPADTYHLLP